jgi:hypothetical protein
MMITGKDNIEMFRLFQMKSALALEIKGLKHSRGSVYALVKKEFNLKGNKKKVYDQLCNIIKTRSINEK